MTDDKLHSIRHTLAHLLATAVLEHDPGVKLAIGPTIDNGFYYDFQFSDGKVPSPEDLKKLEKRMKHLIKQNLAMVGKEISADAARAQFAGQPFKLELINEYAGEGKTLTTYTLGTFTDLCKGGHIEKTKEIDENAFTLSRIAGAYWRGDEKNPMLTRIYGVAFASKEELDAYLTQIEEAKKRDHRKIGKEMGLFVFSELVGAGLPLWTPRGTIMREELNDFVWSLRKSRGYNKVTIPHITKKNLYEKSGHWTKYAEDLFRIKTREDNEYAMKPMNCPHHAQIFDAEPRSYRDMPQRYAETTMVYRDEQSGELSGLSRVLSITQDDAHVFCRENQIETEAFAIWDIIDTFYSTFGFTLTPRFSRHDPEKPEKYLGSKETWKKAEDAILALMKKRGVTNFIDGKGEAAIYGPKIDFMAEDALGRTHQVATIQLDFNQPENFDLVCTNEEGKKERIVMIHAAIMGSIERFLSVYIEHTAGNFPLWLSPVQVAIVPVTEKHNTYGEEILKTLKDMGVRVTIDVRGESLGRRIRDAKTDKVPYVIVVGDKEVETHSATLESRTEKGLSLPLEDVVSRLISEIASKAQ